MKPIVYYLIPVLMLAASCQKEECEQPLLNAPAMDTIWKLEMTISDLDVNIAVDADEIKTLYADHNVALGNSLTFVSLKDSTTVCIARLYDGTNTQLTGATRGKTFVMVDGKLNVCNGPQQVDFTYSVFMN